jgi:hypothetical protein
MPHVYQAVKNGDSYTLYKDGQQAFCPKIQPMAMESNMGAIQWMRFPCSTQCPFATVEEFDDKNVYNVSCEGSEGISFDVEIVDKEKKSGIIKSFGNS